MSTKRNKTVQTTKIKHDHAGRPAFVFDWAQVEDLSKIHCTDEEIAAVLGCSKKTLQRAKEMPEYQEAIDRGRGQGKMSLRRRQWAAAESGQPAMLIWLGKQMLGQADKSETKAEVALTPAFCLEFDKSSE